MKQHLALFLDWLSLKFPTPDPNELHSTKHQQPQGNNKLDIRSLESLLFSLPGTKCERKHLTTSPGKKSIIIDSINGINEGLH